MVAKKHRKGQAAVETMLCVPIVLMVFMSMYYLWSITFASENAHMRAREYVLHQSHYLGGRSNGTTGMSASVWAGSNYKKAERGITPFRFSAMSTDTSIIGMESYGSKNITTYAYISSY
jgi:hypothetical protein